jgi:hypothetical protein
VWAKQTNHTLPDVLLSCFLCCFLGKSKEKEKETNKHASLLHPLLLHRTTQRKPPMQRTKSYATMYSTRHIKSATTPHLARPSVLGRFASSSSSAASSSKATTPSAPHAARAEPKNKFASNDDKSLEELQAELDKINQEIEAFNAQEGKTADDEYEYKNPKTGEIGGPRGPEPTRYGDYAYAGRVTDF